jgi:hypothetical protein
MLARLSFVVFLLFFSAVLVAFWPSYFSRLAAQPTYHPHAHGIAMTLWCLMLIGQALLIRSGHRGLHRIIGRASYVLVPVIVLVTLNFLHFRVSGVRVFDDVVLYFMALIVNALVAFAALYGLAIYHRRNAQLHARFMLATIFPLFTPVTDRLIGAYWPALAASVPQIGGTPVLPFAGFVLADSLLLLLVLWDWRANRRFDAFAAALGITFVYHVSVMSFHELPAWEDFAAWFVRLPLS